MRHTMPGARAALRDHLCHRKADAGAQIEHAASACVQQPIQPQHMRAGKVHDMHIIADAGAVMGWIVVTMDCQRRAGTCHGLYHDRDQVGFGLVPFADLCLGGLHLPR